MAPCLGLDIQFCPERSKKFDREVLEQTDFVLFWLKAGHIPGQYESLEILTEELVLDVGAGEG
jgi:hypothetical protein